MLNRVERRFVSIREELRPQPSKNRAFHVPLREKHAHNIVKHYLKRQKIESYEAPGILLANEKCCAALLPDCRNANGVRAHPNHPDAQIRAILVINVLLFCSIRHDTLPKPRTSRSLHTKLPAFYLHSDVIGNLKLSRCLQKPHLYYLL